MNKITVKAAVCPKCGYIFFVQKFFIFNFKFLISAVCATDPFI